MKKLRMTQQRRVILSVLRKHRDHPNASQLYIEVRRILPRISLGTVYRNLNVLRDSRQILELRSGSQQARYDGDMRNHFHLRCVQCDRIDDVHRDPILHLQDVIGSASDFKVLSYNLEILGVCPVCRAGYERDWIFPGFVASDQ